MIELGTNATHAIFLLVGFFAGVIWMHTMAKEIGGADNEPS